MGEATPIYVCFPTLFPIVTDLYFILAHVLTLGFLHKVSLLIFFSHSVINFYFSILLALLYSLYFYNLCQLDYRFCSQREENYLPPVGHLCDSGLGWQTTLWQVWQAFTQTGFSVTFSTNGTKGNRRKRTYITTSLRQLGESTISSNKSNGDFLTTNGVNRRHSMSSIYFQG